MQGCEAAYSQVGRKSIFDIRYLIPDIIHHSVYVDKYRHCQKNMTSPEGRGFFKVK